MTAGRTAVALASRSVPTGQVEVEAHGDGEWLLVGIGRTRSTKRFNVHVSEVAALVEALRPYLPAESARPAGGAQ